ncbi:P-loop NTPase fold protein [Sphingobacterium sp. UBA5996]|uniref:P-loop NTPase fold protein n=1 Tax=Sphingobacterium sp. UBA5996 TaxID=1947505 RepID=UPI0025E63BD3|nr:P-loop NTPase fold protein [Sphingobacterium sp. UBA5996]
MNIKNDTLLQDFLNHLELEGNNDIIFSAPFGTGKTFFLKEDFVPKCEEQYNAIHLYPVNYSVSSNEDIFELIKYDILFELVLKYKDSIENIDALELDKGLALQLYMQDNFKALDFTQQVFKATTKLGKSISDILGLLKIEKDKFDEFYSGLKANEFETIRAYLESFEGGRGLKEYDTISALISEILRRLKLRNKQNVLIIDDLDRIDPEHIFRIFNVLSAHRDYHTSKNKFGFDKVILVCDIENIKRIYEHRYGRNVDFQGYINKFYSRSIYEFDNRRYIKDALRDYLDNLQYPDISGNSEHIKYHLSDSTNHHFYLVIHNLLQIFVLQGVLSLRALKNIKELKIPNKGIYLSKRGRNSSIYNYELLVLIHYLSQFFGSRARFKEVVQHLALQIDVGDLLSLGIDPYSYQDVLQSLLEMMILIDVTFENTDRGKHKFKLKLGDSISELEYEVDNYKHGKIVSIAVDSLNILHTQLNLLGILEKALTIVENRKLLS